jgi:sortase A
VLRILERCLLASGIACVLIFGAARLDAQLTQARASRSFAAATQAAAASLAADGVITTAPATAPPTPAGASSVASTAAPSGGTPAWRAQILAMPAPNMSSWDPGRRECHARAIAQCDPEMALARLDIPGIHLSVMVLPGVDARALNGGVGHIPGTASPGEPGNVGIAGHRDGFFRGLEQITTGDVMRLTTPRGSCDYRVQWTRIVEPHDVEVLAGTDDDAITLVTCYPFRILGSAPKRFIVRAARAGLRPEPPGPSQVDASSEALPPL